LTWSADSGATCTASDGWSGTQPASGTRVVTPTAAGTLSFTLTCSAAASAGYSGTPASTARSVALTVTAPSAFAHTALVQDTDRGARVDARLSNPWGLAFGPTSPA
jgi:hypothetical protein